MTFAQLKKKTADEIDTMWCRGEFPFDYTDKCSGCVTTHGALGCDIHPDFAKAAVGVSNPSGSDLKKNLTRIVKLRVRFKKLYTQAVPKGFKIN